MADIVPATPHVHSSQMIRCESGGVKEKEINFFRAVFVAVYAGYVNRELLEITITLFHWVLSSHVDSRHGVIC